MKLANYEKPSWAEESNIGAVSYNTVMEIGAALGSEYPHFHAVLTPERNFLHYLIAELICTVAIKDKQFLAETVAKLYKTHVGEVTEQHGRLQEFFNVALDLQQEWAIDFFEHKKRNADYTFTQKQKGIVIRCYFGVPQSQYRTSI